MSALIWVVVIAKVIVHPALSFGLMSLADVTDHWSNALIVVAAGPCGAMPFVIAMKYGVATETMAKAILISTVLTLASLAFLTKLIVMSPY